ncbi:wHTH domain-containing protein [Saccharothrix syringae]|uniref:wHTH-Hsp90 Na associated domain-containing protein n=1 Tax=Saccharothrix syringae TaxID=103733 RepID=A0A5Q0GR39_SACSY|nr:hypothetical protein [Saccharothrix syringae]QFZ16527.1 hypothetical protein EKG83_02745 [Saccharothrix syringae]
MRPAPLPDGGLAYDSHGFRFRLADDRIQELLMGKQLYGDPGLAVRELYQNALDACRYRKARTEFEWLRLDEVVPIGHVIRTSQRLSRTPDEIVSRLTDFGFTVAPFDTSAVVSFDDLCVMSRNLTGWSAWLPRSHEVPLGHLPAAANRLRRSPAEVAERLERWGYRVPPFDRSIEFTEDDRMIVARGPQFAEIVARLRLLGFEVRGFDTSVMVIPGDLDLLQNTACHRPSSCSRLRHQDFPHRRSPHGSPGSTGESRYPPGT